MANAPELSLRGGRRPTWQSRSTQPDNRVLPANTAALRDGASRTPPPTRRVRSAGIPGNLQLPKALTERRYRRNRLVRFYRHLVRTGSAFPRLPRRFAPRNDKSGDILILTVTCTNRQQCAGRGTPRLRDFRSIIIISHRPASASGSPCPDSSAAESHQSACPPAPWPPRRTGSGRRGGRSRAS